MLNVYSSTENEVTEFGESPLFVASVAADTVEIKDVNPASDFVQVWQDGKKLGVAYRCEALSS